MIFVLKGNSWRKVKGAAGAGAAGGTRVANGARANGVGASSTHGGRAGHGPTRSRGQAHAQALAGALAGAVTPRGRRGHSALVHKGAMLIYGGYRDLRGSSNELWAFHFGKDSLLFQCSALRDKGIWFCIVG